MKSLDVPDSSLEDKVVDCKYAAFFLGVTEQVLATWRHRNTGPSFIRLSYKVRTNNIIRYRLSALIAFQRAIELREAALPQLGLTTGKLPGPRPGPVRGWKERGTETQKRSKAK